jgi:hypothetical protein
MINTKLIIAMLIIIITALYMKQVLLGNIDFFIGSVQ